MNYTYKQLNSNKCALGGTTRRNCYLPAHCDDLVIQSVGDSLGNIFDWNNLLVSEMCENTVPYICCHDDFYWWLLPCLKFRDYFLSVWSSQSMNFFPWRFAHEKLIAFLPVAAAAAATRNTFRFIPFGEGKGMQQLRKSQAEIGPWTFDNFTIRAFLVRPSHSALWT